MNVDRMLLEGSVRGLNFCQRTMDETVLQFEI
jgi:hypothetical protein